MSARRPPNGKLRALRWAQNCGPSPQPGRYPDCVDRPGFFLYVACLPVRRAASSLRRQATCKLHLHSCCRQKSYSHRFPRK